MFSLLLTLASLFIFLFGLLCIYLKISRGNEIASRRIRQIAERLREQRDVDERRRSEFLVVRDYVELQNKKRSYVEKKTLQLQKPQQEGKDLPRSVVEVMRKTEEKRRVRDRQRFEKGIEEMY